MMTRKTTKIALVRDQNGKNNKVRNRRRIVQMDVGWKKMKFMVGIHLKMYPLSPRYRLRFPSQQKPVPCKFQCTRKGSKVHFEFKTSIQERHGKSNFLQHFLVPLFLLAFVQSLHFLHLPCTLVTVNTFERSVNAYNVLNEGKKWTRRSEEERLVEILNLRKGGEWEINPDEKADCESYSFWIIREQ